MRLRIDQINRSGDILVTLQNSSGIEDYAQFFVVVRNCEIVKYEFRNKSLLSVHFHYWSRYVCGLYLEYLKRNCGKYFFIDEEFNYI